MFSNLHKQSKLRNGKQAPNCQWIKKRFLHKSAGYDDICHDIVKYCFRKLCDPLLHIFNLPSSRGILPDGLKTGKIPPIYKDRESSDLDNYRAILKYNILTYTNVI